MNKTNRQLQKEQTKELILTTAYNVFCEKGIMNTRMSDIAAAAGVSHGTVFAHYKTQEDLISAVVETYGGKIAERTHELADSCSSFKDILSAHLAGISEYEPFYTRLVIENRLLPPSVRDVLISIQSAVSFHFSNAAGESIAGMPSCMLFNMWIGLVHYYLSNGDLFAPEGNVIERYKDTLINSYIELWECKLNG